MVDEPDVDLPKIKVFKPSDESLKLLGELLTNDTSRRIIMTLGESEMYVNKLAEKLDIRVSLVIHHLKKLGELGLLDITEKPISKRTKDHKFFKLSTDVFLSFTEDKEENKLKKLFKNNIKFTSIGIITGVVFMITDLQNFYNPTGVSHAVGLPLFVSPLCVLITCLIIERIMLSRRRKKKKN